MKRVILFLLLGLLLTSSCCEKKRKNPEKIDQTTKIRKDAG